MPTAETLDVAVVGGGVAGTSTAFWLRRLAPHLRVTLFERDSEAGGKVRGVHDNGFVFDWGPASFMGDSPSVRSLVDALGLMDEVQSAPPVARRRYVYVGGRLQALPSTPSTFLRSRLLPAAAKLRALAEPLVPRGRDEESVHDFLARRFGPAVADRLSDALVAGVSAGLAREVSAAALFPRLTALEQEHGSLLRAAVKLAAAGRRNRAPGGGMFSLAGGTQRLSAALAGALGDRLVTGTPVRGLRRAGEGYQLVLEGGGVVWARQVVLAVPAQVGAGLLRDVAPGAAWRLAGVVYADVMIHSLAYPATALPGDLSGFGYLVAAGESPRSLGAVFTSLLFPDQAPAGSALVRVISGGRRDPSFLSLSDDEALASVRSDLRLTLGLTAAPSAVWMKRWRDAIPQYRLRHAAEMTAAQAELNSVGGLHLTGDVVAGIGVAACARHAQALASQLAQSASRTGLERAEEVA